MTKVRNHNTQLKDLLNIEVGSTGSYFFKKGRKRHKRVENYVYSNELETNDDWLEKLNLIEELENCEHIGVSKEGYDIFKFNEGNNTTLLDTKRKLIYIGSYGEPLLIGYYE